MVIKLYEIRNRTTRIGSQPFFLTGAAGSIVVIGFVSVVPNSIFKMHPCLIANTARHTQKCTQRTNHEAYGKPFILRELPVN